MLIVFVFVGGLECWRQRSLRYADDYKRNYFDVLTELHERLGLAVRLGGAVAMASLVYISSHFALL